MLPAKIRRLMRTVALAGLAVLLPLLYVAGVTLESATVSTAALGVAGTVVVLAVLSY